MFLSRYIAKVEIFGAFCQFAFEIFSLAANPYFCKTINKPMKYEVEFT